MKIRKPSSSLSSTFLKLSFVFMAFACASCGKRSANEEADIPIDTSEFELTADEYKRAGRLAGLDSIERRLSERLFGGVGFLNLAYYLGVHTSKTIDIQSVIDFIEAIDSLGARRGDGLNIEFVNVVPNSANSLFWYLIFSGLSNDLSSLCEEGKTLSHPGFDSSKLIPRIADAIRNMCSFDMASTDGKSAILALRHHLLMYDSTELDHEMTLNYINARVGDGLSNRELLSEAVIAILFNPNFMLQK